LALIKPEIVIVHCSATPDFPEEDTNLDKFGAEHINLWHVQNGWKKIGYHIVIRRTGVVEFGREMDLNAGLVEIGAHCKDHNKESIGVCYIGTSKPTDKQYGAFIMVHDFIRMGFGIEKENWFPHCHFNPNKICPGIPIESLKKLF
jgi:hypothetical protein